MAKSPKIYCLDTGLARSLAGIWPGDELPGEFRGQLIETLCVTKSLLPMLPLYVNDEGASRS